MGSTSRGATPKPPRLDMTTQISTNDRLAQILASIARQAEMARKRAAQIQEHFQSRVSGSGFLDAIECVRSSHLTDLAEDALYQELQGCVSKAIEMNGGVQPAPAQTFDFVVQFAQKLASTARRLVETSSSSFMSNAMAVERHNAVLKVLEFLEDGIEEARKTAC